MATNVVFEHSSPLRLAVGTPVKSNDVVVVGNMVGVALTDYSAVDGKATLQFDGVFSLSVKGIDQSGNSAVAVGDALYATAADTPPVSKKNTGKFAGYALGAVNSAATATIQVRLHN